MYTFRGSTSKALLYMWLVPGMKGVDRAPHDFRAGFLRFGGELSLLDGRRSHLLQDLFDVGPFMI